MGHYLANSVWLLEGNRKILRAAIGVSFLLVRPWELITHWSVFKENRVLWECNFSAYDFVKKKTKFFWSHTTHALAGHTSTSKDKPKKMKKNNTCPSHSWTLIDFVFVVSIFFAISAQNSQKPMEKTNQWRSMSLMVHVYSVTSHGYHPGVHDVHVFISWFSHGLGMVWAPSQKVTWNHGRQYNTAQTWK